MTLLITLFIANIIFALVIGKITTKSATKRSIAKKIEAIDYLDATSLAPNRERA